MGILVAMALAVLCGTTLPNADLSPPVQARATPTVFRPLYDGVLTDEEAARLRVALPCDSVSLQRSGGMVVGLPVFTVTFRKNGEAELSARSNGFGKAGSFVGNVDIFDFGKLCHLLHVVGFERMEPRYASTISDQQTLTVSATMANGAVTVVDYGCAGPIELWSVQRAIEALGWATQWAEQ